MISMWRLNNFKSFSRLPELKFERVNVLAGANSSGKSSIIQSILLLKQTIQYGSENRPIAFNGPLLRLGSFEDVRNSSSEVGNIDIGFELDIDQENRVLSNSWTNSLRRGPHLTGPLIKSVSLNLSYKVSGSKLSHRATRATLSPELTHVELRVTLGADNEKRSVAYAIYTKREGDVSDDDEPNIHLSGLPYGVELDSNTLAEITSDKPNPSLSGGFVNYFLPYFVSVHFDSARRRASQMSSAIFAHSYSSLIRSRVDDEIVPNKIIVSVNELLKKYAQTTITEDNVPITVRQVHTHLEPLLRKLIQPPLPITLPSTSRTTNNELNLALEQLRGDIERSLNLHFESEYDDEIELPRILDTVSSYVQEFFKNGVRYLGPLRESPRPVYQLEALESTTNVGYRGEHTAAILDINRNRIISYYPPPSRENDNDKLNTNQRRASLHDAVVDWLIYLGVAYDVNTQDEGVFGNRLQVSTDGNGILHDLTNVGVGVSQVLPIVVMALLSPQGSVLIFEQPELHLHPKVQGRLADFFLSVAMDGKQTLLETHSEYLIDRLRLRVALSSDDTIKSFINILFTQKKNGNTELTPIVLNEFGTIENWPIDFFDQSTKDINRIIRASLAKQKRQAKI